MQKLYREIAQSVQHPELVQRFSAEGMQPLATTPADLDAHVARELAKWARVAQAAGLNTR